MFHPVSTLEPCTTYTMTVPARTFALRHRTLGAARTLSFNVACPGITALQEALARLGYLPYTLHGFVGASSTAALTRKQAARRAYVLPHGKLRPNVARRAAACSSARWTRRRPARSRSSRATTAWR